MNIGYISDLHLDFYVSSSGNWQQNCQRLLQQLLPEEQADVLVIAGDLSHHNAQSTFALQFFATHFRQVLYVTGNHDYYIVSKNQLMHYNKQSRNRELELQQLISTLPNVKQLQRYDVFTFDGITFAGATNWYGLKHASEQAFFTQYSNDSRLIHHLPIRELHDAEMTAYEQLQPVDIIVTHVPPIHVQSHLEHGSTDCYLNKLHDVKAKHYIFGHCHEQHIYEEELATYYINALGYPDEKLRQSIQLFTV